MTKKVIVEQNGLSTRMNRMESSAMRKILAFLNTAHEGDFSARLPSDWTGIEGKLADALNQIITSNQQMADELERVSNAVGKKGKIRQRPRLRGGGGALNG